MLDQAIELNMIAWYSPVWVKETLLNFALWVASPITARIQRLGKFKSHDLQTSVKDLSDIIQVSERRICQSPKSNMKLNCGKFI